MSRPIRTTRLVKEHIQTAGGKAVVLEKGMNGDMITIYHNGTHMPVLWSHLVPATLEGKAMYNVQNAMFATAMAFCFGVDLDNIRHGLRTFDTSFFQAPGRTNVFDEYPFKVILDYAHNPAAFGAIADLADRMDVTGRRLLVVAMPGIGATRMCWKQHGSLRAILITMSARPTTTAANAARMKFLKCCAMAFDAARRAGRRHHDDFR